MGTKTHTILVCDGAKGHPEDKEMKDITGRVGDRDVDGWVEWTTNDHGMSYNPSISCGNICYVLGEGTEWSALADDAWALHLESYDDLYCEDSIVLAALIRSANDLRRYLVGHAASLGMTHNLPWLAQACDELWAALNPPKPVVVPKEVVWSPYFVA